MKWVLTGLFFFALTLSASAQEFNAGFVQGLWYGDEVVFADTPTRVYVAIRNNTGADLTGTVEFFDNDKRIERNNVSALDGRIIESWADWTPGYGAHTISATLSRIELHKVGSSTKAVEVVSALAESIIFVDYDTDNDGIGNKDDKDDDGDGISDIKEKENGTDPLDANDPKQNEETESESDDGDVDENEKDDVSSEQTETSTNNNGPTGLEQYLTESRADSVFTSITNAVNNTKKRVDNYRETRNAQNETGETDNDETDTSEEENSNSASSTATSSASTTDTLKSETDSGSFGEVTRSQAEKGPGVFAGLVSLVKTLVSSLFTLTLFLLSLYLGHPILVQLTLLFLILFLVYKLARRLGQRR